MKFTLGKLLAVLGILAVIAGGLFWYVFSAQYLLSGSERLSSEIIKILPPDNSTVTDNKIYPRPLSVRFDSPAAALDKLSEPLSDPVTVQPSISGKWIWESDTLLRFSPETDWLPDTEYKVSLPESAFNPQVKIKKRRFSFTSPVFGGKTESEAFYEDPRNVKNKSAVAAFRFNYPLDAEELEKHVSVKSVGGRKYNFKLKLDEADTVLHVVSEPLPIGAEDDFVKIVLSGVRNAYNRKALPDDLTATVRVPGSSSYFKADKIKSSVIRNEQDNDNPEQILFVNFTTAVDADSLKKRMSLYYVPEYCHNAEKKLGGGKKADSLPNAKKLNPEAASADNGSSKSHMFKYDVNRQKGCLVVQISKGLKSVEGFVLGKDIVQTLAFSPYPKEAKIAFDGSVLPLKGSRKVTFVSRGVEELRITVARMDTADLNHLATQTSGDFSHPYFYNYGFSEDNISEVFAKTLKINAEHPAHANYSSLDLNEYFENRKGVFLIKVRGCSGEYSCSPEDRRLIVMTDLGIVVKDSLDGTHDVFVSDVTAGEPVADALVEVLGKNGLPVLKGRTNSEGQVSFPDFSNFKRDKQPVVYKVGKGEDVSFLPVDRSDRLLNLSRFDVGGIYGESKKDALSGYIFSDRGIYRPGEDGHLGIIVRQQDLNVPEKMPFVAEIKNPSGDVVSVKNLWADKAGFMEYGFKLARTAVTGLYSADLYAKGQNNEKYYVAGATFKVDEFQPDSLRIKAEWTEPPAKGWTLQKELKADVSLYNLYGNPAVGHVLQAAYTLTPADFRFKEYSDYVFRDPLRDIKRPTLASAEKLPEITTDEKGGGMFPVDLSRFENGTYSLRLNIEGLVAGGGRGVGTSLRTLVSPNDYLLGWKTDSKLEYVAKDTHHEIRLIAVNNNLQAIELNDLSVRLSRRRYVTALAEMPNGTYRYQKVAKEETVSAGKWQISPSGGKITLKTDEPGEFILSVEDHGRRLAVVEYNVAGAANLTHGIDKDAGLDLKLNRGEYAPGDEIEMQITAPYAGYGLITVERDSVYAFKWFKAETSSVVETIRLPETVEGNAYINVAFFRDIHSPEIYMPSLSYAAAPFDINKSGRRINILLNVPEKVKSGDELVIGYKADTGAKIVIFGVNEGILQVAGYAMPRPLDEFLKKKALRVATSQIMDLIMPDVQVLRMLASSGGDEGYGSAALGKNLNPFARKTDKPVAFWSGILTAGDKEGTYRYEVPETFNGEIKVMAVAVSPERFGSASKSVLSRGDFAIIPSGPVNVSPGDEFVVGVSVGNLVENSGTGREIRVSVDPEDGFAVEGASEQTIRVDENSEKTVKFRLKALQKLGTGKITFTAESTKDKNKISRMPYILSLRPSAPYGSRFAMGRQRSEYRLSDIENLYDEFRVQQLSASASPLVLASGLLKYLDKFPHYCTEQSVSKAFPATEIFFKSPELVKETDVYALFDDVIAKLRERQTLNGGFGAWGGSGAEASPYASVYAAHFLVKAKEHNFNVPENMLKRALSYCGEQASRMPADENDFVPAYAAYVLTLSGKVTTNYLLNLEEYYKTRYVKIWQKTASSSFMAASYALLQNEAKAADLFAGYKDGSRPVENAMHLYLAAAHFPKQLKDLGQKSVETLLKPLISGNFTTDTAAWSLLALNAFNTAESDKNIVFSGANPEYTPFPTVSFAPQTKNLSVKSDSPFYYVVTQQGFPVGSDIRAFAEGLEVSKACYGKDGKKIAPAEEQNGQKVYAARLGDELTVKVSYRGLKKETINDVALVDMLPGCFEVVGNSLQTDEGTDSSEIREDRVVVYAAADNRAKSFSYKVKVIAEGFFTVPPIYGSALYQPLVRANSASEIMQVSD